MNQNKTAATIAIIDDEINLRESVSQWLELSGYATLTFETAESALKSLEPGFDGIVVSDIRMPGMDGMALLRRLQSIDPGLPVILMTGHGDVPMAVEAMRIGAFDFIEKPFEPDNLADLCERATLKRRKTLETRALRRELSDSNVLMRRFMGNSPAIENLRSSILDVAQADGHVLITGETGTGKSLVAKALHACGPQASRPMIALNCASTSPELMEPMLFGSDEWPEKPLVEQAAGGVLCLENVEVLSDSAQARLLEFTNTPADPEAAAHVALRIISVSSALSDDMGRSSPMRNDLYFRLAGIVLEVPPLRTRGEDILTLFTHFAVQFSEEYGCDAPVLNAGDAANLVQAPWPGNIRQLINLAERSVLQAMRGEDNISALLIDDGFQETTISLDTEKPLKEHVEAFEKMLIEHALRRHTGAVSAVMAELALPRRTLNEKMAKYGLSRQDYLE